MSETDVPAPKLTIRLDGRGVAGLTLGLCAIGAGTFVAGVYVGRVHADTLPGSLDELAGFESTHAPLETVGAFRRRNAALAELGTDTAPVDAALTGAAAPTAASSPTDAARIETHRQLAEARARGYQQSLGPVAVAAPAEVPALAPSVEVSRRSPTQEARTLARGGESAGYTLQVSAFGTESPARAVASELAQGGHAAEVRAIEHQGRRLWRVEVGRFADGAQAAQFQKRFEQTAGYSTVVVPVP